MRVSDTTVASTTWNTAVHVSFYTFDLYLFEGSLVNVNSSIKLPRPDETRQ